MYIMQEKGKVPEGTRISAFRDKTISHEIHRQVNVKHLFQISATKTPKMEMNATDMLYEKMARDLAYGDMMAYGPAPISGGGAEFVGFDQHHGVNNVSFEQSATRHGTRYPDPGTSPLPTGPRSPTDLLQRAHYGPEEVAKPQMGLGDVVKSRSKDGGELTQQAKEGGQLGQVRKGKEKPLCDICGQVLNTFCHFHLS